MEMVTSPTPENAGLIEHSDAGERQTTGGLHQADAPPHQDLRISRELNAEKPDMPLTSSGLSYAEHMLHDTMQMTRRSAAAAGATLSRDITQSSRWHECSVAKANSTRAKSPPVSPCMLSATSKTRPARDTAMPWATTTLPKPFALAVDQRARSPRIAAHQPQQDNVHFGRSRTVPQAQHPLRSSSEPKDVHRVAKVTRAQPFHLYSVIRHDLKIQELETLRQKQLEEETHAREFKARPFSAIIHRRQAPKTCPPPQRSRCVTPKPFDLQSQRRHEQYINHKLPEKMRKEAEKKMLELKAAKHCQVQDAEEIRQLRQSLQFQARPAPSRTKPVFAPDRRLAKPPTQPKPFALATSSRCSMDMLGTTTYTQSCTHHAADDSEDFEDDEDLDDGSGCSELDERQTQHPIESNLG